MLHFIEIYTKELIAWNIVRKLHTEDNLFKFWKRNGVDLIWSTIGRP